MLKPGGRSRAGSLSSPGPVCVQILFKYCSNKYYSDKYLYHKLSFKYISNFIMSQIDWNIQMDWNIQAPPPPRLGVSGLYTDYMERRKYDPQFFDKECTFLYCPLIFFRMILNYLKNIQFLCQFPNLIFFLFWNAKSSNVTKVIWERWHISTSYNGPSLSSSSWKSLSLSLSAGKWSWWS